MYNMIKIINTAIYYIWKPLREGILRIPKDSHDKKKKFFLNFVSAWDDECPLNNKFHGHHFMKYVSQIIMLYTLNAHNSIHQLWKWKKAKLVYPP